MTASLGRAWFPVCLFASGLFAVANGAVRPMVSYRALDLGADSFQLGVVASAYAALALLAAIPTGRWIDRYGEGPFLLVGGLVSAGAAAAMALSDSLVVLAIDHALLGLGHAIVVISQQTLIANRSEPRDRSRRFGHYAAAFALGTAIGPLTGGLIAGGGSAGGTVASDAATSLVFAVAIVPFVLAAVVLAAISGHGTVRDRLSWSAMRLGSVRRATGPRPPYGLGQPIELLRLPGIPAALATGIVVLVSTDLLTAYLPAFGVEHGFSVTQVSLLLTIAAAFTLLSRVTIERQVRRWGEANTLASSMLIAAGGFALLLTGRWELAVVALAVVGFGLGVGAPMTMTMIVAATPVEWRGLGIGVRIAAVRLGGLTIPWFVGLVAAATGTAAVFAILLATLGSSGVAVRRLPAPEPLPAKPLAHPPLDEGSTG